MFRKPTFLFCVCFFIASFGTLVLKVYVHNLSLDVERMDVERSRISNEIQVLKAEWSYLNNAERISNLAKQHLGLSQVKSEQVKYINQKNAAISAKMEAESSGDGGQVGTNWRYKSRTGILKIANKKEDDQ